jgi:hypothetical protein
MLPVLVESIGGVYEGDGIALGRSLNGKDTVTLVKKYGEVSVNRQLRHKSIFYNTLWGLKY